MRTSQMEIFSFSQEWELFYIFQSIHETGQLLDRYSLNYVKNKKLYEGNHIATKRGRGRNLFVS